MRICARICCALVVALLFGPASAPDAWGQRYPNKPIRLVMSFSAGSGIDSTGRLIAQKLSQRLDNPVYVENKAGAGGIIGVDAIAKAAPDGYTIGLIANTVTINQSLRKDLPFNLQEDFAFISLLARGAMVLAVRQDLPAQTLPELVALAKAQPGKLNYGTPGVATPHHLAMEMLRSATGMNVMHVPHKGAGEAINSLINGTVDFEFIAIQSALPHLKSGRIRALAVTSADRQAMMKSVPTIAESIGAPGFEVDLWYAIVAPARMPKDIAEMFNRELRQILAMGDVQTVLADQAMQPAPSTAAELRALVAKDIDKWAKVISAAGITAE